MAWQPIRTRFWGLALTAVTESKLSTLRNPFKRSRLNKTKPLFESVAEHGELLLLQYSLSVSENTPINQWRCR